MCNFIMIMILLVTAYNGMWWKPDGHRIGEGYSKYFRQPRVHTVRPEALLGILVSPADGRGIWKQIAARSAGSGRGSRSE